jgi:hypothetical protein
VRGSDLINGEALLVEERPKRAHFGKCCCLRKYFAVMGSAFARNQRKKSEYARIGRSAEGKRSQGVRSPSKAAQNVTGVPLYGPKEASSVAPPTVS